jgi:hypothetical protein
MACPSRGSARKKTMPIDYAYQQHAEENNERELAAAIGGYATRGSAPVDVVVTRGGQPVCGVELKTLVTQGNDKITMKSDAMARKLEWSGKHAAPLHTVVFDDRDMISGRGERRIYHRFGVGSFRIGNMTPVRDGLQGLARLLNTEITYVAGPG